MGNYNSDQKNTRFFGLKLTKSTDSDIISKLESVPSVQGYLKDLIRNDIMKEDKAMTINFEAGEGRDITGGVNYMISLDNPDLYAEIAVPEGASEDYGYFALKQMILDKAQELGINSHLEFWYDGQEDKLEPDSRAGLPARQWYLIDDCISSKGEVFESRLSCDSQEKAVEIATQEWEKLSKHDQQSRDDFYIGLAAVNADGCIDYNTMTDIVSLKD